MFRKADTSLQRFRELSFSKENFAVYESVHTLNSQKQLYFFFWVYVSGPFYTNSRSFGNVLQRSAETWGCSMRAHIDGLSPTS